MGDKSAHGSQADDKIKYLFKRVGSNKNITAVSDSVTQDPK